MLLIHDLLQLRAQVLQLRRVVIWIPWIINFTLEKPGVLRGPRHLINLIAQRLLLRAVLGVLLWIERANGVGSLEHHVLKEVADASDARSLIHRADFGQPTRGDHIGLIGARN